MYLVWIKKTKAFTPINETTWKHYKSRFYCTDEPSILCSWHAVCLYYTVITVICNNLIIIFLLFGNNDIYFTFQPSAKMLVFPVLLRAFFIPLFLVLNYQPKNLVRVFPVLISNDWVYWIAGIGLGLSSGYFSSIGMMYCPR